MAVRKKTRKNGGQKPTMQPEKDKRNPAAQAEEPAKTVDSEAEAVETLTDELEDATACEMPGEQQAQAERAKAAAETAAHEWADALVAANAKADEYLNLAQHVQADFDNYRRRNQNTRADAYEDGARAFITTLLPVLDNLERAIGAADDSADKSLRDGVVMVHRQLAEALTKRGVTPIDRKGEKFDPNLENAVMQGVPEDGEPGTVCDVLQKGYQMGGCVLRHAMVKVVPD